MHTLSFEDQLQRDWFADIDTKSVEA